MIDERQLAESLRGSLHRRADGFAPEGAELDHVVRRARRIRRRRRTVVSAAAAVAVAALAVPTSLALGGGPQAGRTVPPAHSGTPAPSATPSVATPTPHPSPSTPSPSATASQTAPTLTLAGIRRGGSVDIGWLEGRTWHNGSSTLTLPAGSYAEILPYRGGFLVTSPRDNGGRLSGAVGTVTWLDNTMRPQWTACGSDQLALSGDQMTATYSRLSACSPSAGDTLLSGLANGMSNVENSRPVPAGQLAQPVGQNGQVLVYDLVGLTDGQPGGVWWTDPNQQQPPKQVPGLASAAAVDPAARRVSGLSSGAPHTGVVVDPVTGKVAWSAQDWGLGRFSLDGKYVAAAHSAGAEPDTYAILDAADGHQVTSLDLSRYGMQVVATAWNADDSLLLLVDQGGRQAVVRLTPQGQVTRVTPVLPANPRHAIVFATRP
jgi:hypothetical protein